jgi:N6-adenosine-specific RNA methylase IME4
MNTQDMLVNAIVVGPNHRAAIETTVAEIAKSIDEIGLTNPISVRRMEGGRPYLIAGRQRLEAHKKLKRETIRVIVFDDDDLKAKLRELDENLCRAELTPAEEDAAHHERKQTYEALHPETKPNVIAGKAGGRGRAKIASAETASAIGGYTATAAKATGKSKRKIQKQVRSGAVLGGTTLAKIKGTSLDKREELDALVEINGSADAGPKVVAKLVERAAAGEKVSAKTENGKQKRSGRERSVAAKIEQAAASTDTSVYGIILTDPPWSRETWSEAGKSRDPANHYPTQGEEYLSKLPIPAAPDCILFMWSTQEHLAQAMRLIVAWGFTYKSGAVWVKPKMSTGYWFRTQHELVLVATKGSPVAPAPGTQISSVFEAPVGRHSEKPPIVHEMIERLWPTTDKLEMFARAARPGWARWGAEAPEDELPAVA